MPMAAPGELGSGICLATTPWLEFCGLTEADVAFRDPKDIIQGPLTQKALKKQMRDFFRSYESSKYVAGQHFTFYNVINYRWVDKSTGVRRVPFKFTLQVK